MIPSLLIAPVYGADDSETLLDPNFNITLEETAEIFPQGPFSLLINGTKTPVDIRFDYDKRRLELAYTKSLAKENDDENKRKITDIYDRDLKNLTQQFNIDRNDPVKMSIQTSWVNWFSWPSFSW